MDRYIIMKLGSLRIFRGQHFKSFICIISSGDDAAPIDESLFEDLEDLDIAHSDDEDGED
jgi:hypothetical protein